MPYEPKTNYLHITTTGLFSRQSDPSFYNSPTITQIQHIKIGAFGQ